VVGGEKRRRGVGERKKEVEEGESGRGMVSFDVGAERIQNEMRG
jgi:hypothetical protein